MSALLEKSLEDCSEIIQPRRAAISDLRNEEACLVCKEFDFEEFVHLDLASLLESANSCSVCALIKDLVISLYPDQKARDRIVRLCLTAPSRDPAKIATRMDIWFTNNELKSFSIYTPHVSIGMQSLS